MERGRVSDASAGAGKSLAARSIVTFLHRPKRAPRRKAGALDLPVIVATASRERKKLLRVEYSAPVADDPWADAAMRAWLAREMGQGTGMTDALPTPRSLPHGYDVSAWCRACQHTVRLDLPAMVAGGHGDVPLVHLPLRCRCGSDRFGVIVGAVSAGKWQPEPGAAA